MGKVQSRLCLWMINMWVSKLGGRCSVKWMAQMNRLVPWMESKEKGEGSVSIWGEP